MRIWCLIISLLGLNFKSCGQSNLDFETQRMQMVERQIKARGIRNQDVLKAMRKVERHLFVPQKAKKYAYSDNPASIGYGQTISQPYVVAFMTEVLDLIPGDRVLEIGTGSGYQAAILGEICNQVYSIEIVESLGQRSKSLLDSLGYKNIKVRIGDGYQGWPEFAPFDAIIVTCAPNNIPEPLQEQLAEGGKMIIPVGSRYQKLVLIRKENGKLKQQSVMDVRFVPMVDDDGDKY